MNLTLAENKTSGRRPFSILFIGLNDLGTILYHTEGRKALTVARLLREEGVKVSRVGISKVPSQV